MFTSRNTNGRPAGTWNNTYDDSWGYPCNAIVEVVPEPASFGLLALGGLAVLRRKRRSV